MGLEMAGAAKSSVAAAMRGHHRPPMVGAGATVGALRLSIAAEDVELVDEVEHHVSIERIAPRVGAHHRIDGAGDAALL